MSTLPSFDWLSFQLGVFSVLNKTMLLTLSHTHALFRVQLSDLWLGVRSMIFHLQMEGTKESIGRQMEFAIRIGKRDLCELMCELVDRAKTRQQSCRTSIERALYWSPFEWNEYRWNRILRDAAFYGSCDICVLARERGATCFNAMLVNAAFGGHCEACHLAYTWINQAISANEHTITRDINWDSVMCNAVRSGNVETCELIREWGVSDGYTFNWELTLQATSNTNQYDQAHELLRKWQSTESGFMIDHPEEIKETEVAITGENAADT